MSRKHKKVAVRHLDLAVPIPDYTDVKGFNRVRVYVSLNGRLLDNFELYNRGKPVSAALLRQEIAEHLTLKLFDLDKELPGETIYAKLVSALNLKMMPEVTKPKSISDHIDVSKPLREISDILYQDNVCLPVQWRNRRLGDISIANHGQPVSVPRLQDAIVESVGINMIEPERNVNPDLLWSRAIEILNEEFLTTVDTELTPDPEPLPDHIGVSIVVATRDRPDDLRECLTGLTSQKTNRPVEIIVVDNNPGSGVTPKVVSEFEGVRLIDEQRKGLSYARNAGFVSSTGEIAIATDDDVIIPPDWLENLVRPFARSDVMIVTGNVLPIAQETRAQQLFEIYGGLGRGFERFEAGTAWFEGFRYHAAQTWRLGATANAAFRTSIFAHPEIGLLPEELGAGMPTGCSEDTYLFYKVLKVGFTIAYEPEAYVWHKHRKTMKAFRKQLYNYSKGGVAYNLLTFLRDGDFRGLVRVFVELPVIHTWRLKEWLLRRSEYPPSLLLLEALGNWMGIWALMRSWLRVKRLGRSGPFRGIVTNCESST